MAYRLPHILYTSNISCGGEWEWQWSPNVYTSCISPTRNEIPSAYKTFKLVVGFFSCPSPFAFIHFDLNRFSVHYIKLPQSYSYDRMENGRKCLHLKEHQ